MTSLFIPGPCTELRKENLCNLYITKEPIFKKNSYNVKCNYKYLKINLKDEDLVMFFTLHLILWMNGGTSASKLICLLFGKVLQLGLECLS